MNTLTTFLLIDAILLVTVILLQQRSSGLGGAFGGDDTVFTSRRGAEKSLHRLTILLGIVFVALGLYLVYVQRPPKAVSVDTSDTTTTTETSDTTDTSTTTNQ